MKAMKMKKKASARTIETYAICGCVYAMCSCSKATCSCDTNVTAKTARTNSAISNQMSGDMVNGTV